MPGSESRRGGLPIDPRVKVHTGSEPLDVAEAMSFVSAPEAGGTCLFAGTVRSPNEGAEVGHLDYEVWEDRVNASLETIAVDALARFGASRAYVAHRSGRVGVGEASVVIAVSAPHRGEAFDASRFLIDTLKATAPIWKHEITEAGDRWVGMPKQDAGDGRP